MSEHKLLSVRSVDDVADVIAGRIAAGDMLVPCRGSRRRLVAKYLARRGLVEIVGGDLMRPLARAMVSCSGRGEGLGRVLVNHALFGNRGCRHMHVAPT